MKMEVSSVVPLAVFGRCHQACIMVWGSAWRSLVDGEQVFLAAGGFQIPGDLCQQQQIFALGQKNDPILYIRSHCSRDNRASAPADRLLVVSGSDMDIVDYKDKKVYKYWRHLRMTSSALAFCIL